MGGEGGSGSLKMGQRIQCERNKERGTGEKRREKGKI